jgi:cytoskeletal protein CcmA (bactofilin family)
MFSKASRSEQKPSPKSAAPSIISVDLRITGDVVTIGDIQVDGTIEGDIQGRSIVIGEEARVRGAVTAESVRVTGTIVGSIRAASVALDSTAKVTGDIFTATLAIEAGAYFEGRVERTDTAGGEGAKAPVAKLSLASHAAARAKLESPSAPAPASA